LISVVIPNYNRKDLLASCLGALRAQTFRDFEVIVVDNGSADGSAEMVTAEFSEARLVRLDDNMGFSKAVNAGIGFSRGEFVALLNNDADADPSWLGELYNAACKHPEAGLFASKMLFYDNHAVIDTVSDGFTVAGFGYKVGWGETDAGQYDAVRHTFGACAGAAMYRKDMLERIKLDGEYFDEQYFAFGEDIDLNMRAQSQGYKCVAVPSARVYHRVRATAGISSSLPIYLGHRNTLTTVIKNFPPASLVRHSFSIILFLLLTACWDFVKTRRLTVLKAYICVLGRFNAISKKRASLKSVRSITGKEFEALLDRNWFGIWLRLGRSSVRVRRMRRGDK